MKKILSIVACSALAACSCSENQWEAVDVVEYEEPIYDEQVQAPEVYVQETPAPVVAQPAQSVVRPAPVYVSSPQVVYDSPYTEVQPAPCGCCQAVYYQPQPCGCCQAAPMPAPQPKVTTTKKIITTTTTYSDCGSAPCQPVVTTHEEVVPAEVSYTGYNQPAPQPAQQVSPQESGYLDVTVESNPYNSAVVDVRPADSKADGKVAASYSPEAYNVIARRATNRMLQDTSALYGNGRTKRIFLKDTKLLSSDLPYGSHRLRGISKEIISGSETFDVINNQADADYILDSAADWYVSGNATPALQYKLTMLDKSGKKINEWVEIIRQLQD